MGGSSFYMVGTFEDARAKEIASESGRMMNNEADRHHADRDRTR